MDKKELILDRLLLGIFAVFPFGQIFGLIFNIYFPNLPTIHLLDILVILFCFFGLLIYKLEFQKYKYFFALIIVLVFSFAISLQFNLLPFLYLFRFITYLLFGLLLSKHLKKDFQKKLLIKYLYIDSLFISFFGLVQYFLLPDLRQLKVWGWDDHYFRLVSTFLDPAFVGIIIVLGIVLSLYLKKRKSLLLLVPSLLLTYSRASFLSLVIVSFSLLKPKKFIIFSTIFVISLLMLPTNMKGEGVNLLRTSSIFYKLENYQNSLEIIKSNPLFGVGYNNICNYQKESVNSCYGLDNSFLLILATTGVVGIISFFYFIFNLIKSSSNKTNQLLVNSLLAIFVHTQFTNTIFYSWVLVWMASIFAISQDQKLKFRT